MKTNSSSLYRMENGTVSDHLVSARLVPVVSEADPRLAMLLADALVDGGLPVIEVTLRQEGAIEALRAV